MIGRLHFITPKLPYLFAGLLVVTASLFLVLFVQGCIETASAQSNISGISTGNGGINTAPPMPAEVSDSPNAITVGMENTLYTTGQNMGQAGDVTRGGLRHVAAVTAKSSETVTSSTQAAARNVGSGIASAVRGTARGVAFVLQAPIKLAGLATKSSAVSSVIIPADHSEVPIIDPNDPALLAAQKALPAVKPASQPANPGTSVEPTIQEAIWPIHGQITTYFGEKGRYYATTHTGIDISDGRAPGVTPVKAFRYGKVIAAGKEGGLGNRVVVDHGSNITSIYGHLASIAVQVGQEVNTDTSLGLEGTTGLSTGTHVHFEIRINNQATDPRNFITGLP